MKLQQGEFPLMRSIVLQLAGVVLDESKGYLIENRLGPVAERHGCANFNELYFKLRYGNHAKITQEVVDAITTHETNWFRDSAPFDALQFKAVPESLDARSRTSTPRRLRIWSAACSTGQEPYGISMVLHDLLPDIGNYDIQILATDISQGTLAQAERGVYGDFEMQRNSRPQTANRYFEKVPEGQRVVDRVRRLVTFKPLNLLEPLIGVGPFDIVFLRNVLIYFEGPTKAQVLQRVRQTLLPHGWLFVGATENLLDHGPEWTPKTHCRAAVYQPNLQTAARPLAGVR